jgi:hypothetical protein
MMCGNIEIAPVWWSSLPSEREKLSMESGRLPPDDPREWLNRARSSLAKAREGAAFADIYLEDLCFDAQQAAEKAIKAVLLHLGVGFPYVHDLPYF